VEAAGIFLFTISHQVAVYGCDLSTVVLPQNGNYRRYGNLQKRFQFLLSTAEQWENRLAAEARIFAISSANKGQNWGLFNVDEDPEMSVEARELIFSTLDSYQAS